MEALKVLPDYELACLYEEILYEYCFVLKEAERATQRAEVRRRLDTVEAELTRRKIGMEKVGDLVAGGGGRRREVSSA